MTTTQTITARKEAARIAYSEASAAGDSAAAEAAYAEIVKTDEQLTGMIREAVDRGIDRGPVTRQPLDTFGREAMQDFVATVIDILNESRLDVERDGGDKEGAFAASLANYYAESPLFPKLLGAYRLELDATNGELPLPNGIIGRAVDKAIEDLMPYATHQPGWYTNVVAPKL